MTNTESIEIATTSYICVGGDGRGGVFGKPHASYEEAATHAAKVAGTRVVDLGLEYGILWLDSPAADQPQTRYRRRTEHGEYEWVPLSWRDAVAAGDRGPGTMIRIRTLPGGEYAGYSRGIALARQPGGQWYDLRNPERDLVDALDRAHRRGVWDACPKCGSDIHTEYQHKDASGDTDPKKITEWAHAHFARPGRAEGHLYGARWEGRSLSGGSYSAWTDCVGDHYPAHASLDIRQDEEDLQPDVPALIESANRLLAATGLVATSFSVRPVDYKQPPSLVIHLAMDGKVPEGEVPLGICRTAETWEQLATEGGVPAQGPLPGWRPWYLQLMELGGIS